MGALVRKGTTGKELRLKNGRLKTLIGELTITSDSSKSAGREEKMTAVRFMIKVEEMGMSLRKAPRYSGMSSCSYYYQSASPVVE